MIGLALSLLTSRVAGPVATIAAVLALGFGVTQCSGRVKAERVAEKAAVDLKAAKLDLRTCQSNQVVLTTAIDRQSAAVEAVKREGEARVAESAKAVRSARAVAESLRKEAGRILEVKVGADACESADALVLEAVN